MGREVRDLDEKDERGAIDAIDCEASTLTAPVGIQRLPSLVCIN